MKTIHSPLGLCAAAALVLTLAVPSFAQDGVTQTLKKATENAVTGAENLVPQDITITATDYKFTPSHFTVAQKRRIRITLVNNGKKKHNIQFDLPDNNKLKISQDVAPGASGTLTFTAPGPGTHTFSCPVDLHSTMGMRGTMTVTK
jgi:uncharacterized cupredoxin-like copper-binding protein